MKIALTGASGFVAAHIRETFKDHIIIERRDTHEEILAKLEGVDVVINLAGAPIIKRWNEEYKRVLIESRVQSTRKLVDAINISGVKQLISTSAIGAYPDGVACDENFVGYGSDFLARLTKKWETEALKCNKPTAIIRFGVILGTDGGALASMLTPFRFGAGGIIGNGEMMMSWIDIDDLVGIYSFIIDKKLTGVYNATSPKPITNYHFTKALGRILHRPTILPLPEFVLKLIFGEGATVLTGSKEVYPKALIDAGFEFKYEDIDSSLRHLLA